MEDNFGEILRWAIRGRGIIGKNWWTTIGVAEIVLKEEVGAWFGFGKLDGFGYFEECGGLGFGGEVRYEFWPEVGFLVDVIICRGGERVAREGEREEEEDVEDGRHWWGVMLLCFRPQ